MILNEEKFLEDFTYDIPRECERDFTLVVRQSKSPNITINSNAANGEAAIIGYEGNYRAFSQFETDSIYEDIYYKLPNNYKYQLKFIVPRADKDLDSNGLILPINDGSNNYFNTFLRGKLTQENGFVSYNKIYNKINTKIPDKYRCNGNYIIGCKFLPFVFVEPTHNTSNDYIFIFDITKDIGENKTDMTEASDWIYSSHNNYKESSSNNLYFIMFDFNIEGYSEDDGIVIPEDSGEESIKDLLYHQYGNVFPREPYKIMHKKHLGNDIEILVYKKKDGVDYSNILSSINGIRYSIGSGYDKFVMIWKEPYVNGPVNQKSYKSDVSEPEITYVNVVEALKKEGYYNIDYDPNDPSDYVAIEKGGIALDLYIEDGEVELEANRRVFKADINDTSISEIVGSINNFFEKYKNN